MALYERTQKQQKDQQQRHLRREFDIRGEANGRIAVGLGDERASGDLPESVRDTASSTPVFFFALEGEGTRGNQVPWGAEFTLLFNYDILRGQGLAAVKGGRLNALARPGVNATLGVEVMPVGLTLLARADGPAVFKDGALTNGPLRFRLRAPNKDGAQAAQRGVTVVFTIGGAMIYNVFLEIALTDVADADVQTTPVRDLDLEGIVAMDVKMPRIADITISAMGDVWAIYGTIDGRRFDISQTTLVSRAALETAYRSTLATLASVAGDGIWRNLDDSLIGASADEDAAQRAMKTTAAAGWKLYKLLATDPAFERILSAIDALPDGSCIAVYSNTTVFPWEVLYPVNYVVDFPQENFLPERFWGQRFVFESLVLDGAVTESLPKSRRQPAKLKIDMALNSGIDTEPPWVNPARQLLPVKLQKDYCDEVLTPRGVYFDTYETLAPMFLTGYPTSMIYCFCHGATDQLKFDKFDATFGPEHIMGEAYPGWPVIFLNACDAADIGPLSFFSFRTAFRQKKAAGLIAPSFPVSTLFAALFGRAFLYEFTLGRPVGEILLGLRRRLLKSNNPLGLWYSLQCPLDLQAPET